MMLVGMYAVEWEKRAREERERQAEAKEARLAHVLWSAGEAEQPEKHAWQGISVLKRLVSVLGYTGM
jgi:hypothetical protein